MDAPCSLRLGICQESQKRFGISQAGLQRASVAESLHAMGPVELYLLSGCKPPWDGQLFEWTNGLKVLRRKSREQRVLVAPSEPSANSLRRAGRTQLLEGPTLPQLSPFVRAAAGLC